MANAFSLAEQHLKAGIDEATAENISLSAYGQALLWKLIERYQAEGRSIADITAEIQYSLDNISDDNTFHVSRN